MAKKRSNGEGSIRKLPSGTWFGQIMDGYTEEGKKNLVSFSAPTKSEVLDKIRTYKAQKEKLLNINKSLNLSQWADTWYVDYKSQVQPSTYAGYKYTLKIIKQHLGAQKVCEVLPIHINNFMDALVDHGYSLSQIRKCRTMLIQIFDAADNNGLVARNPARKAKIIKDLDGTLSKPRIEKDSFTDEEVRRLRDGLDEGLMGNSIRLMLDTGLRGQELLALTPADIAPDGSSVSVTKAIKTVDGVPQLGPPKSKHGTRTIPVPEDARDSACYLREHGGSDFIWHQSNLHPLYSVGSFRRRYYNALAEVEGVRKLTPHCCRHTYVTRLQAKGVPLELIARLAGHGNIATTDDYAHTTDDTLANAVAVLNEKKNEEVSA